MKNLKFSAFCLGLVAVVGVAVASVGAQEPRAFAMLDGRGSQLGVMVSDVDAKSPAGVKVDEVNENSPAEKAGLKAGDVVVEYDGERIRSARQFTRLVQETPDGRSVKIAVLRNGQRQTLDATPEASPSFSWNMNMDRARGELERNLRGMREFRFEPAPEYRFRMEPGEPRRFELFRTPSRGRLGVTVESLSEQLGTYFGVKDGGALVSSVTAGSAAEKAGIKAGDVITSVNGRQVHDADSLSREIGEASGTEVSIGLMRDKKETTVKAQIEKPASSRPRVSSRPGVWM
jgi:serine protease Do